MRSFRISAVLVLSGLSLSVGAVTLDLTRVTITGLPAAHPAHRERVKHLELVSGAKPGADGAFRIHLNDIAPDNWGVAFRAWPMKVRWWRHVSSEIKAKYPEMEMDD